ncbi:S-adenosylhomocysteine deaminase [Candidatus Syntrophocurvum alkaliphilum]|uniref:5-methylthioadenosine/S-adenosylhomocysteine deaminase n=1 Tax=Candidatus Syntrophocurvum alkaliphilum TaxID=2293317 RepID=A0A6I6D7K1_9FIRM|nr:amidohydrolase [Candidatus Syntrophocurvum alkaliphilum]QGT99096.1 S-adenosylhomocysteine deaminase [Candidatus Syntrophocurvum alkaliphilum]
MSILIKNVSIVPLTENNKIIEKGYIIIENNMIKQIGEGSAPDDNYVEVIDGTNNIALPGFINTHTHAAMTLLRGYADDLPLMEWLETKIWPLEAKLTAEDIYWGTKLAIVEMIKSGTTTFTDMYFHMDKVAEAVKDSGIRAVLSRGMIGIGPESDTAIEQTRTLVKNWHNQANGRIKFALGPHAPYTCPPDYLKKITSLANELNVSINIHLAETKGEFEDIKKQYDKTPIALMEQIGLFNHHVIAAHCVHITEEDIDILKKYNVGVAHNPESNMKLASGIAPVSELLSKQIAVGLGTDGASSNNNLDMLEEMRSAALLHKVNTMNPTVIPAYQALEMATINGALVLGLDGEIGQLREGLKADIIMVEADKAHMIPRYDLIANLVYSAQGSDVNTVIIDGQVIMKDGNIVVFDEQEVLNKCKDVAERLMKEF